MAKMNILSGFYVGLLVAIGTNADFIFQQNETLYKNSTIDERYHARCDCGVANRYRRIMGGHETPINKYPWVVALFVRTYQGLAQFCGGSLIGHWYVLTAAHCFSSGHVMTYQVLASLGDHDIATIRETENIVRTISRIIIHEEYYGPAHTNDVALLRMSRYVQFTENIRPICMPPRYFDATGKYGIVTGWGVTSENGIGSTRLLEVILPILTNKQCSSAYHGAGIDITKSMLCAGYPQGGADSCQGDSGGSMVYRCGSNYFQVGIVSFGIGCGRPGLPGVYTRLSSALWEWVVDHAVGEILCGRTCYQPKN